MAKTNFKTAFTKTNLEPINHKARKPLIVGGLLVASMLAGWGLFAKLGRQSDLPEEPELSAADTAMLAEAKVAPAPETTNASPPKQPEASKKPVDWQKKQISARKGGKRQSIAKSKKAKKGHWAKSKKTNKHFAKAVKGKGKKKLAKSKHKAGKTFRSAKLSTKKNRIHHSL